ncbi:aminotransferase class I/II-fold pyridoxal phosphate-dependent enzyme [Streptomyces sp. NPDC050560]|uniref:aminotransferase class I/II-fold pyridoxal phosphate-dependent enzyme n=1 Tax=Streptomyces sp. NPDC050560 TaxID=3365630 RepID=UPI0037B0D1BF
MLEEYPITGRRAAEIAQSVERAVGAGSLEPGAPLPPMRELAARLGVNPHTVAAAYRTLRERGVVESAGRRGTRVRPRPVTTAREMPMPEVPPGVRDLTKGGPDPVLLPPLSEAFARAAAAYDARPVEYGDAPVDPGLAAHARAELDADGVPAGPVAVTSGALDAMERVLAARLRPGDAVAVEDPGWSSFLDLVPALGLVPAPFAVDDEGPLPESVDRALASGARALVVTSRAQNPTGAAVTGPRAKRLRAVLARHPGVLLVEDDHGHGIVDEPLCSLAPAAERWALARSTSKAYGPDLRLAVLTGDAVTVDLVEGRQRLGPGWVSRLHQRAVLEVWRARAGAAPTVAASYGHRRNALIRALAARGIPARGRTGMNVWVTVPDETAAVARLLHAGWAVTPGARYRSGGGGHAVRITVSPLTAVDIEPLADAVAAAVSSAPARRYD